MAKYRTIAVKPETYDRFEAYKFRSMTADDVINWLMDHVPLDVAIDEFKTEMLGGAKKRPHPKGRRRGG